MTSHPCGRRAASPAPASPIEDEDLLSDILIRLPPSPSSLPRASLACKRWRRLATDPHFLRRFRAHHRKAPTVGVFLDSYHGGLSFSSILDPPDHIPPERFSVRLDGGEGYRWYFRGCRHGRALLINPSPNSCGKVLVWDPVTGDHRYLGVPPQLDLALKCAQGGILHLQGAVLCVAGGEGHVHGACHSSPFKVVLVGARRNNPVVFACVYSSETGEWGDVVSTALPPETRLSIGSRTVLVGNCIYWLLFGVTKDGILEFDFDRQSLTVIDMPLDANVKHHGVYLTTLAEGGGLGFVVMIDFRAQFWERTTDFAGVSGWMPGQSFKWDRIISLKSGVWASVKRVLGIDGNDNVMFVSTRNDGVFMVHLESMQFKKIFDTNPFGDCTISTMHPFTTFYAAGLGIGS